MVNLFEKLAKGRPQRNGEDSISQDPTRKSLDWLQHDTADAIESEQDRQERLEARLDALAADLRRFRR